MESRKRGIDKRLSSMLLTKNLVSEQILFLDTYNQAVRYDIAGTIRCTVDKSNCTYIVIPNGENSFRIRKLTEKECFRLMDVPDCNIARLLKNSVIGGGKIPKGQLYKMAGNSIVVGCMSSLFRKMFLNSESESCQMELF